MERRPSEEDSRKLQKNHVRKEDIEREPDVNEQCGETHSLENRIQRLLIGTIPACPVRPHGAHAETAERNVLVRIEDLHEEKDSHDREAPSDREV